MSVLDMDMNMPVANTAKSSLNTASIGSCSWSFGQRAQYRQHAPYGEVEHEIGFKVEVVGVKPQHGDQREPAEVLQGFDEFRRAVRSGEQREPVKTPTLFGARVAAR